MQDATKGVGATGGAGCHGWHESLRWTQTVVGWNGQRRKESTSVDVQKNSPKDRGKEKWSREAQISIATQRQDFSKKSVSLRQSHVGLNEVCGVGFPQRRLRGGEGSILLLYYFISSFIYLGASRGK